MRSKVYSAILFFFLSSTAVAQFNLSGVVKSKEDSASVGECVVHLNNGKKRATTDSLGNFIFRYLPAGNYVIHFNCLGYEPEKIHVTISNVDQNLKVVLTSRNRMLDEVTVSDTHTNNFGLTKMNAVENMGIYEAKKSEVIIPEQLVANLSTNNARQIYSRVAGLNIWENDGAGLQLSIGGRGLDPNRTSNFNVRQNGYDISADALGYPESYYTPSTEGVGKIQIVRGAASLQYGTQFGGLINFMMKKPVTDKKIEVVARQTGGSFGFYNAFLSASGTVNKLSYYTFYQYKRGDGWRQNSQFENQNFYSNINYALTDNTKIGVDVTHMDYLAQQPGGLSQERFDQNPRQSIRDRNWFKVNWNLFALHIDHKFNTANEINVRVFGLSAYRYSVGFRPNRVDSEDDNSERDLIKGDFTNWGIEARYLKRYSIRKAPSVLLVGGRYYHGFNHSTQGLGSTGKGPNFNYVGGEDFITYDYRFPNRNVSLFSENVLYAHDKLSFTQGIRYEYINTTADGYYGTIYKDLAGNIIEITKTEEERSNARQFLLMGLGISYRPSRYIDIYSNISQNYRSITFSDMRISNPSSVVDQNLEDEKGYSFDVGVRSEQTTFVNYDVSLFYMNYGNRIGEVQFYDENDKILRKRGNIGEAIIQGVEAYGEFDVISYWRPEQTIWNGTIFSNLALIHSRYKASEEPKVTGKKVEFVPDMNLKCGFRIGYQTLKASFQYSYLSSQFTDATNETDGGVSEVIGTIPAYSVMDISLSYSYKKFRVEGSVNNVADKMYFTRRATGYPGPGILPSDGRSFYISLQLRVR